MKSYGGLWHKIIDYENLVCAYADAARYKRYTPNVLEFAANWATNLNYIQADLESLTWHPSGYTEFYTRNEIKLRLVQAPPFKDRVVHHAICRIIGPILDSSLIYDTYACRTGKGTHAAVRRVQHFLRCFGDDAYVLQIDVSKYFPSVSHDILMERLEERFRERRLLTVLDRIVRYSGTGRGLPIGALTSQMFANYYLSPMDHFAKECLSVKAYVRYMDDAILVFPDKAAANEAKKELKWFLEAHLNLKMNPKSRVYKIKQGVDFAGYRTWKNHLRPRRRIIKAARKRFKRLSKAYAEGRIGLDEIRPRVMSFLGYMERCDSYRSTNAVLAHLILCRKDKTNENNYS